MSNPTDQHEPTPETHDDLWQIRCAELSQATTYAERERLLDELSKMMRRPALFGEGL